jgi:hypothetical protein
MPPKTLFIASAGNPEARRIEEEPGRGSIYSMIDRTLIRRDSVLERLKFRLRMKAKAAITQLIVWLSALWDRI